MNKIAITSNKAPKAASFFSQGVLTANKYCLELSGQIGLDPQTGKLVEGGVSEQTEQIFRNIDGVLSELGWTFDNITKTRVFLTSMSDYQEMNDVYAKKFGDVPPARVAVAVKELPLGAAVEVECVAEG
ncbi:MAG: Rid family detoxifying hydrolase, partial [Candidatus Omnitrophica bacterium]|nr:Rid family detoxifying hydrolase [Candidatus Omnitrophota bacterium]